jgi:hypothetical protein
MIPYGVVWIWTWTPAFIAICAFVAAPIIGILYGDWATAGGTCLIGLCAAAGSALSYLAFWQRRNSN